MRLVSRDTREIDMWKFELPKVPKYPNRDPLVRLAELPWWITFTLGVLVYYFLEVVLPSLQLPDVFWVVLITDFLHTLAPFIACLLLGPAVISALLSRHKQKQQDQTQKELLEVYRVMEDERTATDNLEHPQEK